MTEFTHDQGGDPLQAPSAAAALSLIRGADQQSGESDQVRRTYLEVVSALNDRMASCVALKRQGFLSEALRCAGDGEPVLEEAAALMGPVVMEWLSASGGASLPLVDRELAAELNEAFELLSRIASLLVKNRRLALRRAPVRDRLYVVRKLAALDYESSAWEASVAELEGERLKELASEVKAALESEDPEVIDGLHGELSQHWTIPLPKALSGPVNEVHERQVAAREADEDAKAKAARVAELKRQFSDGLTASLPLIELTLIWSRLGADTAELPADQRATYEELMRAAERKRTLKRALKWSAGIVAVAALLGGAIVGIGFWQQEQARTSWRDGLESAVEEKDWARAQAICVEIQAQDMEWWNDAGVQSLAIRLTAGRAEDGQRRLEFERLIKNAEETQPLHALPSDDLLRLQALATSAEQKQRVDDLKGRFAKSRAAWQDEVRRAWREVVQRVRQEATVLASPSLRSFEDCTEAFGKLSTVVEGSWQTVKDAKLAESPQLQDEYGEIVNFLAGQLSKSMQLRKQAEARDRNLKRLLQAVSDPPRYVKELTKFINDHEDGVLVRDFQRALKSADLWLDFAGWDGHPASRQLRNPTTEKQALYKLDSLETFEPRVALKEALKTRTEFLDRAVNGLRNTGDGVHVPADLTDLLNYPWLKRLKLYRHKNGKDYYATGWRRIGKAKVDAFDVFVVREQKHLPKSDSEEGGHKLAVYLDRGSKPELTASPLQEFHEDLSTLLSGNHDWLSEWQSVARESLARLQKHEKMDPTVRGWLTLALLQMAETMAWPPLSSEEKLLLQDLESLPYTFEWLDPDPDEATKVRRRIWARLLVRARRALSSAGGTRNPVPEELKPRRFVGHIMPDATGRTKRVKLLPRDARASGVYETVSLTKDGYHMSAIGEDSIDGGVVWKQRDIALLPYGTPVMWHPR